MFIVVHDGDIHFESVSCPEYQRHLLNHVSPEFLQELQRVQIAIRIGSFACSLLRCRLVACPLLVAWRKFDSWQASRDAGLRGRPGAPPAKGGAASSSKQRDAPDESSSLSAVQSLRELDDEAKEGLSRADLAVRRRNREMLCVLPRPMLLSPMQLTRALLRAQAARGGRPQRRRQLCRQGFAHQLHP